VSLNSNSLFRCRRAKSFLTSAGSKPGTNVMILKIFSPKLKLATNMAFFTYVQQSVVIQKNYLKIGF
jgi:hypothetical protein